MVVSGGVYSKREAEAYNKAKQVPMRSRVELYTTLQLVGNLQNQSACDVACGSGWLTKELKTQLHAEYVVGTDLSNDMIEAAREQDVYGIDYIVEDARKPTTGMFDVVTSGWLLVNATDRDELAEMCRGLAAKLRPGGRLITIITNPDLYDYPGDLGPMKRYGFEFQQPDDLFEGAPMQIMAYTMEGEFMVQVENYHFAREAYVKELELAGFEQIEFVEDLMLAPLESGENDSAEWEDFFRCPLFKAISAVKK